jgi:catechol 1,2-dioxygenase/hydroxyquinol 1,2-dioxygenase
MIEYTSDNITDATLEQMSTTTDARLKTIMESAVRHLHAFAREVNLTPAEWIYGIQFMTRVGQMCSASRQEFILLSDTLGLSTLVNTLHDTTALEDATHTSLLGPFFRENTPRLERGAQIGSDISSGEIVLWGRVTNTEGAPLANAMVTVWQTAANGSYDMQTTPDKNDYRGSFVTAPDGSYVLKSVKPRGYYIPMDGPVGDMIRAQARHGMRPAHIHFLIGAVGYRELVTALYVANDPHLHDDVVFGASGDLIARIKDNDPECPIKGLPSIRFDFTVSRESEADRLGGRVGADPAAMLA